MEPFDELDTLLKTRHFEPAFPALAERIINASKYSRRHPIANIAQWLKNLFADFSLPQPAYALAAMLMLGVGIGLSSSEATAEDSIAQSVFSDEGTVL